jgi:hypothetical protein
MDRRSRKRELTSPFAFYSVVGKLKARGLLSWNPGSLSASYSVECTPTLPACLRLRASEFTEGWGLLAHQVTILGKQPGLD